MEYPRILQCCRRKARQSSQEGPGLQAQSSSYRLPYSGSIVKRFEGENGSLEKNLDDINLTARIGFKIVEK